MGMYDVCQLYILYRHEKHHAVISAMIRSLGQAILYRLMVNQLRCKNLQTQENQNSMMRLITVPVVSKWCTALVAAWWTWHVWAWQGELRHTHTPQHKHTHTHTHQYSCSDSPKASIVCRPGHKKFDAYRLPKWVGVPRDTIWNDLWNNMP